MDEPRRVLPVRYGDCTVFRSPPGAFLAEAGARGLADRVVPCPHGRRAVFPPGGGPPVVT
ncbi:hypothetical protein [Streptomyces sp. AD55]|uniref:hypothetical protein n=1 Tax=Streptomyces sp. AD55 TaxID=3242895 RepID=UPI0035276FD8